MKALIIGIDGFVGKYLESELRENGYDVYGTSLFHENDYIKLLDVLDEVKVSEAIKGIKPDVVFNMAGQASAASSWETPGLTMDINIKGAVNILEAIKKADAPIKVLLVGSAEQYGILPENSYLVDENTPLNPTSPYAISKCTQEQIGLLYGKAFGINVFLTRSFNHIGAGQSKGFVVPDIASGIVEVESGNTDRMMIGNLSAKRDFTDVRDVVCAYRMIVEKGRANTVYNVGSGNVYSIAELLEMMLAMSYKKIPIEEDPQRMRKSDNPIIQCNNRRLKGDTGWVTNYDIKGSLLEILESFRA